MRADRRALADAVLAVVLVGLLTAQALVADVGAWQRAGVCAWGLTLLATLALRRRMPLVLLGVLLAGAIMAVWASKRVTDVEAVGVIVLLSVYNGAAHTAGRRTVAAAAITVALAVGAALGDPAGIYLGGVIFFTLLFGAPWVTGRVVRRRRLNEARLERERDSATEAISEERARIARELHDVVAHAISVIVLQARGGRRLLDEDPDETRQALATIEHTGQQALTEMRRLVGLLREGDAGIGLDPQPGLARLEALVGRVRDAGLPVDLEVEGTAVPLPPGVDLSAYRIVQEALTNSLKHAGPARARVLLRYEADGVTIDIRDDGAGTVAANGSRAGHGLVGIRERVALFGGDLDAGPAPEGGFTLRARLPFGGAR